MNRKERQKIEKRLKLMDVLVVAMFVLIIIFVAIMIYVFLIMGSVPDTLIVSVFAWFGLEAGALSWIKTTKDRLNAMLEKEGMKNEGRNDNPDYSGGDDITYNRSTQKNARRPKV